MWWYAHRGRCHAVVCLLGQQQPQHSKDECDAPVQEEGALNTHVDRAQWVTRGLLMEGHRQARLAFQPSISCRVPASGSAVMVPTPLPLSSIVEAHARSPAGSHLVGQPRVTQGRVRAVLGQGGAHFCRNEMPVGKRGPWKTPTAT